MASSNKKSVSKTLWLLIIVLILAVVAYFLLSPNDQITNTSTTTIEQKSIENSKTIIQDAKISDTAQEYNKPFVPSEGFADLVDHITPSVVNISAVKVLKQQNADFPLDNIDPNFRELFKNLMPQQNQPEQRFVSLGSGFVIRSDGFIVTNNHVIQGTENIQVNFPNGTKYNAVLYATDEQTDIAILKIEATNLNTIKFGDSDKVRVGDWVIAIGNPFGLGGTVSAGIISAIGRDINIGTYNDFIQTDAAINKGNSGGPMINTKGEIIGINTAIFSTSGGGSIGIGFSVPSNVIQSVISQLITNKKVTRSWLGVQIQPITDNIAEALNLTENTGVIVSNVVPGSPADKVGLKTGDIILAVNGDSIKNSRILPRIISNIKPGTVITISVLSNKIKKDMKVEIQAIPEQPTESSLQIQKGQGLDNTQIKEETYAEIGLRVVEINDAVRKYFGFDAKSTGLVIFGVRAGSIAQQKGLNAGLKILSINQSPVSNLKQMKDLLTKHTETGLLLLIEDSSNNRYFVSISKKEITQGYVDQQQ